MNIPLMIMKFGAVVFDERQGYEYEYKTDA